VPSVWFSWLLSDSDFSLCDCTDVSMQCSIVVLVVVVVVRHVLTLFCARCVTLFVYCHFLLPPMPYKNYTQMVIRDTVVSLLLALPASHM